MILVVCDKIWTGVKKIEPGTAISPDNLIRNQGEKEMKKSFLIVGALGAILATNGYANIVISEDTPDMTITVSRGGKLGPRVAPKTSDMKKPTNMMASEVSAQIKATDGGAVAINCPVGCTPDCAILGNVVLCECKDSKGGTCNAEVVTSDTNGSNVAK